MNKTIKIIELLNKLVNGEELPKRIKYKYNSGDEIYIFKLDENNLYIDEYNNRLLDFIYADFSNLSDEVEIIEEENKMDIQSLEDCSIRYYQGFIESVDYIEAKINELLQAVKQLDITKEDKQC